MPVSPAEAVAILTKRWTAEHAERESISLAIRRSLPGLVDLLVREYGARRVVLFGSLARDAAHRDTDIDIAVRGLAPERYFEALARCAQIAGRNVDLVLFEEARPDLLLVIQTSGEVLYAS